MRRFAVEGESQITGLKLISYRSTESTRLVPTMPSGPRGAILGNLRGEDRHRHFSGTPPLPSPGRNRGERPVPGEETGLLSPG